MYVVICRWVEEDPMEILNSVKLCMEKAIENLQALNISNKYIKVAAPTALAAGITKLICPGET